MSEDLREVIEKANQVFGEGFKKGDAALTTSMYTDDTLLLPPNMEPIRGKENAEAFWGTSIRMGVIMEEHKIMEIIREGDTATEWGTYVVSFHPEGQESVEEKGKYVVVWKRMADSSWKKHWDIWNSSMPLPPIREMVDLIQEKIRHIESETGNKVRIKEDNTISHGAILDWGNWGDMTELPWIRYKHNVDKVHILHELIHLEKFFVNHYSVIACNDSGLHPVIDIFKNIPEDFVAHKITRETYGFNPIDTNWFEGKNNLGFSRKVLAAYLIQYHLFSEFCPEYLDLDNDFQKLVKENNHDAYRMAVESWEALEEMDIQDKDSYDACADEIIKVFAPELYGIPPQPNRIYTASVRKNPQDIWEFNR